MLQTLVDLYETPESHIRLLDDGTWVMAKRLMFHWMLIRGLQVEPESYYDRYCYQTEVNVLLSLYSYPQEGGDFEPLGWHRHPPTHRRRPDGDPTREYIDP